MMKRRLCILLALVLVCVFFSGCAKGGEDTPDVGSSESVQPSEEAPKRVLACWMSLADSTWQMMSDMLQAMFEEGGYEYHAVSGEGDPLVQLEQIENGVVQGYDLIYVTPINGETIGDACQAAMDAGVPVYAFMNSAVNSTVYRTVDTEYAAVLHVQYAAQWVDEHFPDAEDGSVNTVLVGQNYNSNTVEIWECLQREVKKYPKLNIIEMVTAEESIIDGQAKAENILTMHADQEINLWIVSGAGPIVGVNAAIMAENSGVGYKEDCGIIGDIINSETANMLRLSKTNESVLRCIAAKGGRLDLNLLAIYEECDRILRGETVDAFSPVGVDLATPDNLADFGY